MTDDQHEHRAERTAGHETRGPDGKYIEDVATAERDHQAAEMRSRGLSYRAIAHHHRVSVSTAHGAVQRALAAIRGEGAAEVRDLELDRLDELWRITMAVLEREHVTVSNGRVVHLGEKPLRDDGPVLAAVDRLLRIQERRAKLLGLDAEKKINVSGGVTYEVVGVDVGDLA